MKSSDLSPNQKLYDLQRVSYPQKGRIPAQSMYNIKFLRSEKLIKSDMPYQLFVYIEGTKCAYHNSTCKSSSANFNLF